MLVCFAMALASSALAAFPGPVTAQQPRYQQDAIDNGAVLYQSNCAACHADGAGVSGIDLGAGVFKHSTTDEDLMAVIKNGEPGTAMPGHPNFAIYDVQSLVAYIRTMRDYGAKPVKLGDVAKGRALFEGPGGCLQCHSVNGKGSVVALDLGDVGSLHPPAYLERALIDPDVIADAEPQNRMMRGVRSDGTVVLGRRLNEDTFTVQLIDQNGTLVSLEKAKLRSLVVDKDSRMPSFKEKLNEEQISDLVAYLASLKPPAGAAAPNVMQAPASGGHQ